MLAKLLPSNVYGTISTMLNMDKLYEVRLRADRPITVNYGGKYYFLSPCGITAECKECYTLDSRAIGEIVIRSADHSMYAVSHQLNEGYLTVAGGIRVGISGEIVWDKANVRTLKGFYSVNIRLPHEIKNCAMTAMQYIVGDNIHSTLVVSPPGAGKTTFLRDMARLLGSNVNINNVLLVDERNEMASLNNGVPLLDVGLTTDIMANCSKQFALEQGVRCMRPDVIVTDELACQEDIAAVEYAVGCGVAVIASIHARNMHELGAKSGIAELLKKKVFTRFVVLSNSRGPGTLVGIFADMHTCLYAPAL